MLHHSLKLVPKGGVMVPRHNEKHPACAMLPIWWPERQHDRMYSQAPYHAHIKPARYNGHLGGPVVGSCTVSGISGSHY